MTTPYLLTGVTGGLGTKILFDLLHKHRAPPQDIIVTSRSATNAERYISQGLQFRVADYDRPETLASAFADIGLLLFMSSATRDTPKRNIEHKNVVEAAKAQGVKEVWYVSLAFGGFTDSSKIGFQLAHYETENMLKESGLKFISLRAGVYADAFPLFLNYYPSSETILLPVVDPPVSAGKIAYASRDELGEGIAALMAKGFSAFPSIRPKTDKNIVLLTGTSVNSLDELVPAINRARSATGGKHVAIKYLPPEDWITASAADDEGGKGRAWFEARLVFTEGVGSGDAETVDPALETLLGRTPETGIKSVERFVRQDPGYTWHQNYAG